MGALATDKELRALQGIDADGLLIIGRVCRPSAITVALLWRNRPRFSYDGRRVSARAGRARPGCSALRIGPCGWRQEVDPGPGPGNYLTMARSRQRAISWVIRSSGRRAWSWHMGPAAAKQNHGVAIMSTVAKAMVSDWRVSAIKSHTGHSWARPVAISFRCFGRLGLRLDTWYRHD